MRAGARPGPSTARIRARGADAEVLLTQAAVERYNELARKGRPVGALIHSTC